MSKKILDDNERFEMEEWTILLTGYSPKYIRKMCDAELKAVYELNMPMPEDVNG